MSIPYAVWRIIKINDPRLHEKWNDDFRYARNIMDMSAMDSQNYANERNKHALSPAVSRAKQIILSLLGPTKQVVNAGEYQYSITGNMSMSFSAMVEAMLRDGYSYDEDEESE